MISLRFFLQDGFQTKAHYGEEAEIILAAVGDKKTSSDISFIDKLGNVPPGQMFKLTEDIQVRIRGGNTTVFFRAEELMLFYVQEQATH